MINGTLSKYATHDNSAYPQLWRGCVGAWCPSLGPSGSRLFDYSRRNNWGTLTNMDPATDWVVSDGQYALDFDGVNDMVECNNTPVGQTDKHTVCAWVRPASTAARRTVLAQLTYDGTGAVETGWLLDMLSGGAVRAVCETSVGQYRVADSTTALTTSKWWHVAGIRTTAQTIWVAINGRFETSNTIALGTMGSIETATTFQIGGESDREVQTNPFSQDWSGYIDDVRLYDRALSASELRLLATRRGIAFTPRTRRLAPSEQAAGGATPWLYARRMSRIIGGGVS